jgi:hypothetical protein
MIVIVIELFSIGGFPLKEASENCFLSTRVLISCCGSIYSIILLLYYCSLLLFH